MRRIDLDAAKWSNVLDFYDALLGALGAPDWHGRGIDALVDTMIWSDEINAVKPPYAVIISNMAALLPDVRAEIEGVSRALREARAEFQESKGRDINVSLEIS